MTRLTLLAFVSTLAIIFLDIAVIAKDTHEDSHSAEHSSHEREQHNSDERSGQAFASAKANVLSGPGGNVNPRFPPGGLQQGYGGGGVLGYSGYGFVECFVCTDCQKILSNTTTKICPRGLDVSKQNTCVVYAEKFHHMKKHWYTRGCASERGSCADIRRSREIHKDVVSLDFCIECEGNKCNRNGASRSDLTIAAFVLIITPILAKYSL